MPRELFGEVVHPAVRIGGRRWYSLPLTLGVHAVLIAVIVIVPMIATGVLPSLPVALAFPIRLESPTPPPGPPTAQRRADTSVPVVNQDAARVVVPTGVAPDTGIVREPETTAVMTVPGGLSDVEGLGVGIKPEFVTPPPPPAEKIRIGQLNRPTKIKDVVPEYPTIAVATHTAGSVIIEATLDVNGRVTDARILKSVPLLDNAALDAVRQWVYTPTRLNGVPVAVVMTVTVTFTLR